MNIPSKAIMLISGILLAGLIATFMFVAARNGQRMQLTAIENSEDTTNILNYDTYSRYNGETITGSQIIKLIEDLKDDDKYISVSNDGTSYQFYLMKFNYTTGHNEKVNQNIASQIAEAKKFVSSNAMYNGQVMVYADNVMGIQFTLNRTVADEVDRQHIEVDSETTGNDKSGADREFTEGHLHIDGKGNYHPLTQTQLPAYYKGGCYTVPVYHEHTDECIGIVHSHYYKKSVEKYPNIYQEEKVQTTAKIIYDKEKLGKLNDALVNIGETAYAPTDGIIVDNIADNGCYTIPIWYHHKHTENCYSYKYTHRHVDANGNYTSTTDPNDSYPKTLTKEKGGGGGCYVVPIYHKHTDECYENILHAHSGSSQYGTGCYTTPSYHKHVTVKESDYQKVTLLKDSVLIGMATYEYTRTLIKAEVSDIQADSQKITYSLYEEYEKTAPADVIKAITDNGFTRKETADGTAKYSDLVNQIKSGTYTPEKGIKSVVPDGDTSYTITYEDGTSCVVGHKLNGYTPSTSNTKYRETLTRYAFNKETAKDLTMSGLAIVHRTSGEKAKTHQATGKVSSEGTCFDATYYMPLYRWSAIKVSKSSLETEKVTLTYEEDYTWSGTKKPSSTAYKWAAGGNTLVAGGRFVKGKNGLRYRLSDGSYIKGWVLIDASVSDDSEDGVFYAYYFNDDGYMELNKSSLSGPKGDGMFTDDNGRCCEASSLVIERNSERFAAGTLQNDEFTYSNGTKAKSIWLWIKNGTDKSGDYAYQYYFDENGKLVRQKLIENDGTYKYVDKKGRYCLIKELSFNNKTSKDYAQSFTQNVKYGDSSAAYNDPDYGIAQAKSHISKTHTWERDGYTYTATAKRNSTNPAYNAEEGKYVDINDYVMPNGQVKVATWSDLNFNYIAVPEIYGYTDTVTYYEGCIYEDISDEVKGTDNYLKARNLTLSCKKTETDVEIYLLGCGYEAGDKELDKNGKEKKKLACGKYEENEAGEGTGTIEEYGIGKVVETIGGKEITYGCTMAEEKPQKYSACSIAENTLIGYELGCDYAEDNTGYICGKTSFEESVQAQKEGKTLLPTIDMYTTGCGN